MKRFSFRIYFLLIIPVVLAVLALCGFGFFFKSGTALAGIFILYFLHYNRFKHFKDVWMIIAAFIFSIAGDWFLSNKQDSAKMFVIGIALFFFAHLSYLVFALMNGKVNWRFTFIILTAYLVFYFLVLFPAFDNDVLKWTALVYLLISCF